jgi:hypothetical protein
MLKHPIAWSGVNQVHGWCVTDFLNACYIVRNMTQLFSFPTPKEFVCLQLHATGRKFLVQYRSGTEDVALQTFSRRTRYI